MDESSTTRKRRSGQAGGLVVTRSFDDSLIMRLGQGVDEMLFARELFETPIRITIMKGKSQRQVRVGIFADRRINIAREEIIEASPASDDNALSLHRRANLALAFMQAAENTLDQGSFKGLLAAAQNTVDASHARAHEA